MQRFTFGRWTIDADVDATRLAFESVSKGGAESCGCQPCLNYVAYRDLVFPADFQTFLRQLGVNAKLESDVSHFARLESGLHFYGGWFHFIGMIVDGLDAYVPQSPTSGTYDLESLTDTFSYGISNRTALVPDAFPKQGVVQLEFHTEIPWVIEAAPAA